MCTVLSEVPVLKVETLGDDAVAVVMRWGRCGELLLRAADRLGLGPPLAGDLLVLAPRGFGRPMLGRRTRAGLVAEPGGVPASSARWAVVGGVRFIERDLERSVAAAGPWSVVVRIEPMSGVDGAALAQARSRLHGGRLSGAQLDALCLRAALAPDTLGVRVAVAAAPDPAHAAELLSGTPAGSIRFDISEVAEHAGEATLVAGPWPMVASPTAGDSVGGSAAGGGGSPAGAGPAGRHPRPLQMQLSLFGDTGLPSVVPAPSRRSHAC